MSSSFPSSDSLLFHAERSIIEIAGCILGIPMNEHDITYSIEKSRQGPDTILVHTEGREIYLHSRIDPERESELLAGRFDPGRFDVLIVLGCGMGYHLLPLREILDRYSDVIIIDVLPGLEKAIAGNGLTSFLTSSSRVMILAGKSVEVIADLLTAKIDMDRIRGVSVLEHPASTRAFGEYYDRVRSAIEKLIHVKAGNKATREAFGARYVANILRNVPLMEGARPVRGLFGAFCGHPAVLAVSGPSLDADIGLMKKAQRRFIIVAVDSALPVLHGNGIVPDLVITVDPQPYVREHFIQCDTGGAPVVCSLSSHPSVLGRPHCFLSLNSHPFAQLAAEVYGDAIGSVDSSTGSVAGDAIRLCHACGFSGIGVTGLDFSFSGYAIYARGTAYQKRYASFFQDRCTTVEGLNCRYILRNSGGLKSGGKYTRKSFLQYRQTLDDFLLRNGMTVTLLNDRGLPLAGARTLNFEAFIGQHCKGEIPKQDIINSVKASAPAISSGPMAAALTNIMHERLFDELLEASLGGRVSDRERGKFRSMINSGRR
jgi:hypothetical protein